MAERDVPYLPQAQQGLDCLWSISEERPKTESQMHLHPVNYSLKDTLEFNGPMSCFLTVLQREGAGKIRNRQEE